MGDRLGTPGVVDSFYFAMNFAEVRYIKLKINLSTYNHQIQVRNILENEKVTSENISFEPDLNQRPRDN